MLDTQAQIHSADMNMDVGSRLVPTTQNEKIIFCIDLDLSMDEHFMIGEKLNDTRINRTKQVLKWFIAQKSKWNAEHEFAVIILGEKAVWHVDFTTDTVLLEHAVDELYTMGKFPSFDSTSLFELILQKVEINADDCPTVQAIMIYTRSDVLPTLPDKECLEALHATGKFFFDCVYIHNKASEVAGDIKPQEIYDRLTEMEDSRSPGYFYELTRVLKKFSGAMGELLANPAVRAVQEEGFPRMAIPPSVRAKLEMMEQQQQQQLQKQAPSPSTKRTEIPVTFYKSTEMMGASAASQLPTTATGGNGTSAPRTPPPPPSTSHIAAARSASPFGSANPSRGSRPELAQVSSRSGSMTGMRSPSFGPGGPGGPGGAAGGGSGSRTGAGSGAGGKSGGAGTGMDDAILI
ncbi:hypothetical protein BGZ88_007085 [Linnemannia elongata]|nr:hypothetical protein BGZ88_007085 [Linnemannia elongata]